MAELIPVTSTREIPLNKAMTFEIAGKKIAIFNVDGEFFAIDDTCPHAEASLAEGHVYDGKVVCPWHAAEFDLATGKVLCPPAIDNVRSYKVVIKGDEIQVALD